GSPASPAVWTAPRFRLLSPVRRCVAPGTAANKCAGPGRSRDDGRRIDRLTGLPPIRVMACSGRTAGLRVDRGIRQRSEAMAVKPKPDGYHSVTPYLAVDGAARLIDFVKHAFKAEEVMRLGAPGDRIGHAEVRIGDTLVMVADAHDGRQPMQA